MRIAHVIDHYQPHMGYQEVYLVTEQTQAGHDVCVITSNLSAKSARRSGQPKRLPIGERLEFGVTVRRLPGVLVPGPAEKVWIRGAHKALEQFNPDVVHCHGMLMPTAVRIARFKSDVGFRLLYDTHDGFYNANLGSRLWRLPRWLYHKAFSSLYGPKIVQAADVIVAIGVEEREYICERLKIPVERVKIVPLGADTQLYHPDSEARCEMRANLGIKEEDVVMVHAGSLEPHKAAHLLVEAIILLREQGSPVQGLIIGSGYGKYAARLRRRVDEKNAAGYIRFVPFVERKILARYLNASDVAVWPGLPSNTMIEAMATGLPLVINDAEYMSKRFDRGVLFFENGSLDGLGSVLCRLVDDKHFRQEQGQQALSLVTEDLNWQAISNLFVALYAKPSARTLLNGGKVQLW